MKFVIGEPIEIIELRNVYVLEVEAMHGDGDKYETITLGPFTPEHLDWLEQAVTTTKAIHKLAHSGRDYDGVEGYGLWYSGCVPDGIDYDDPIVEVMGELPRDCTCDGTSDASITNYEVVYYDNLGTKYKVEIVE